MGSGARRLTGELGPQYPSSLKTPSSVDRARHFRPISATIRRLRSCNTATESSWWLQYAGRGIVCCVFTRNQNKTVVSCISTQQASAATLCLKQHGSRIKVLFHPDKASCLFAAAAAAGSGGARCHMTPENRRTNHEVGLHEVRKLADV